MLILRLISSDCDGDIFGGTVRTDAFDTRRGPLMAEIKETGLDHK